MLKRERGKEKEKQSKKIVFIDLDLFTRRGSVTTINLGYVQSIDKGTHRKMQRVGEPTVFGNDRGKDIAVIGLTSKSCKFIRNKFSSGEQRHVL